MVAAEPRTPDAATCDGLDAARRQLDKTGYCVIPDVLDTASVAALRSRIDEQADAERALGLAHEDGGPPPAEGQNTRVLAGPNQRVFMLVNKGQAFVDLITHPVALALTEHVLGRSFLLSQFSANIAKLGGVEQGLHCDDWWAPRSVPKGRPYTRVGDMTRFNYYDDGDDVGQATITPCCMMNFAWMVSDFTDENGGTRVVPGSHLSGGKPDSSVPHKIPTVAATGKAGALMAFDGRLWHGTGRNVTPDPRIGLLMTFCGPQFRPQENVFLGLDPKVYEAASPKLRELLGFRMWSGYGRVEFRGRLEVDLHEPHYPELRLRQGHAAGG